MRWMKKNKTTPKDGETRVVSRFLIFPWELSNQYRWLEWVKIKQRYVGITCDGCDVSGGYWIDVDWELI